MKIHVVRGLALGFALCGFVISGLAAGSQEKTGKQKEYERLIYSVKGPDLFRANCAACHGSDGKGGGPVASTLKVKPADLTVIARKSGGKFPTARVRRLISGDEILQSHGSREMPIWGPIYHQVEADQDFGNVRLQNLIKYLESIQQK